MRYKVTLAYDGNNYVGFQSQKNGLAIQDVLEKALKQIFGEDIRINMASRTDAGVHALGQVFHFDSDKTMDGYKLKGAINALIPKDIHILKAEKVSKNFHARFMVEEKTYEYKINLGEYDVFKHGYAYQCFYKLDLDLMKKGAELFIGKHDFSSFNTTPYSVKADQTRTITEFKLIKKGDLLTIRVTGDGFLRNMVRIMVGTLIDLGRGKKSLDDIKDMLATPKKDTRRYNIDPNGLYLVKIKYYKSFKEYLRVLNSK
ncbi:MAG: tRNA pseudouridine(38-40) synthase TruA [Erysipelotrichaceae bacterium]|nr:tRNA pseudouridine(38-40) synthase TruA [Erysipelotrichaceae bacterium]